MRGGGEGIDRSPIRVLTRREGKVGKGRVGRGEGKVGRGEGTGGEGREREREER